MDAIGILNWINLPILVFLNWVEHHLVIKPVFISTPRYVPYL